jgi:ribonuclease-3
MRKAGSAALDALEARLGHRFADRALLEVALTHPSAARRGQSHYQRLEFLGDRVLGLAVADRLFRWFPEATEGEMSRHLAELVRKETCADVAVKLGLGEYARIAGAHLLPAGGQTTNILGDLCEALIAALYLDGGMEVAGRFVEENWKERIHGRKGARRDPKTELQEWAQGRGKPAPQYRIVEQWGPAHETMFRVVVAVEGIADGSGEGKSRREAEKAAAAAVLAREGVWKAVDNG